MEKSTKRHDVAVDVFGRILHKRRPNTSPPEESKTKSQAQKDTENHNHRIYFSYIAFVIAIVWLIFVGIIICLFFPKENGSSVMIALLTTSTATVIGLPYLVLQGTYGAKKNLNQEM